MKVVVMGNNDHIGGLIIHYIRLVFFLKKSKVDFINVNINDKNTYILNDHASTEYIIPYKTSNFFKKVAKYAILKLTIYRLKKYNPDLFIASGTGYGYAMIARALPSTTLKVFQEVMFADPNDAITQEMIKSFDAVAVQTPGMIHEFQTYVSTKLPVNYLPCFAKEYSNDSYHDLPTIDKGIRLVYFGRLAWNKGLVQFINYNKEVFLSQQNITLDIFGGGPEQENIQRVIHENNLQNSIQLKGRYSDEEFPELISSYHGVIIPSTEGEGLPLVLLEAMKYGRPVYAATTGAMPEVGQTNIMGMVVTEKDETSMRSNLYEFISKINKGEFHAKEINYIKYYSSSAFEAVWLKMLENPRAYFLNN
jgi:glycosyltransferase involved in cell wall biosynthesis